MILASAQGRLGGVMTGLGRLDEATELLIIAQKSFSDAKYPISKIGIIIIQGIVAIQKQDFDQAERLYRRALSIARTVGKFSHVSLMMSFLSGVAFAKGDLGRATDLAQQAVDIVKSNNSTLNLGARLGALAVFLILGGKIPEAREAIEQALRLPRTDGGVFLSILQAGALLLAFEGHTTDAARLVGFVDHYYGVIGATRAMADLRTCLVVQGMLKNALSEDEIRSCAAEGAAGTEDLAVGLVLRQQGPTIRPISSAKTA
jgi:tetratricopeptide (TPR) repeat protein